MRGAPLCSTLAFLRCLRGRNVNPSTQVFFHWASKCWDIDKSMPYKQKSPEAFSAYWTLTKLS